MTRGSPRWALLALVALAGCGASSDSAPVTSTGGQGAAHTRTAAWRPARLRVVATARLPAPVEFPSVAKSGNAVVAAGGLSAQDTSVADVVRVTPGPPRRVGGLPVAAHDAGAASLDGRAYAFGGGTASGGLDSITRLEADGRATVVGRLPVAMSDTAAAAVGGSIDVVGGYSTVPLRTVLSFRPGRPVRSIATLPHPTRYAAAASSGGRIVVAGGTDGTLARRDVLALDARGHAVRRIGGLPRPTAHAAAATLGRTVYVLGGRGAAASDVRADIYAVDAVTGRVRVAGRLPVALSDLQAVARDGRIVVVGGRDAHGVVHDEVWTLAP